MKFQVWHIKDYHAYLSGELNPIFPDDFEHVADVEANNYDEVFALTNHINTPWFENDGVTLAVPDSKPRSTSVGDVVLVVETIYRCAMLGWNKIKRGIPVGGYWEKPKEG